MATLGAVIGAGGLGTLIFTGLVTKHWNKVITGTLLCVIIATFFNAILSIAENSPLTKRRADSIWTEYCIIKQAYLPTASENTLETCSIYVFQEFLYCW